MSEIMDPFEIDGAPEFFRTARIGASALAIAVSALAGSFVVSGNYRTALMATAMVAALGTFSLAGRGYRAATRARHGVGAVFKEAAASKYQIEELFAMTDMLQAADDHDDAAAVLMATSMRLLPEYGAALYIFNNSRDRLDLTRAWNLPEGFVPPQVMAPANCWALKRGKPHINDPQSATLCCAHHSSECSTVEIPMMARGTVHGLLVLSTNASGAFANLMEIRRLGRAVADSMSLALSNISLREKLRTQSLRDPLTGLYNRRYMEDTLERFMNLASRTGASTAVIMLDLDNFKLLNDEHGHAKGDAVLRDVAAQLIGGLRPADVVCRYGGEELVVLLPECSLDDALAKAEHLRQRLETLSEVHEVQISASFGVASVPETSTSVTDVMPMADAALYAAKAAGKNCVRASERRAAAPDAAKPRLARTS